MKRMLSQFHVQLVPVGTVSPAILEFLALTLPDTLGVLCRIRNSHVDVSKAYSTARQQYNSTEILAQLVNLNGNERTKILGVTDVDLFIPILTFVFGEAQLGRQAALISVHRLHQQFYGLPEDEELFFERCEKEALHELGHAFGLVHCRDFECVMHFSNSIEQVDLKSNAFCSLCADFLSQAMRA
ncbi:MAG: archaemetzincin family Zn-dependent metalloprotease [Acidobacteria bacterium]|nr:archaemetzincin family Zn-dependent metalloprotease [Acidobacteriota bacterium]